MGKTVSPYFIMDNLRKFIRIYTPFIVTLANLIYGVYYLKETLTEDIAFCINVPFGCSFSFVIYAWAASKRMCIWYKLNLLCNLLMLVDTVAYYVIDDVDKTTYSYIFVLLATAGLVFFLIFWFTYVLFRNVTHNHRCSREQE